MLLLQNNNRIFKGDFCTRSIGLRARSALRPKKGRSELSEEDNLLKYKRLQSVVGIACDSFPTSIIIGRVSLAVTLLTSIREMFSSSFCQDTGYHD
jgi:hypothetical protein